MLKLTNLNPSPVVVRPQGSGLKQILLVPTLKGNLEENFIATKISNGYGSLNVKEVKNGYKIILSTHSNFYI